MKSYFNSIRQLSFRYSSLVFLLLDSWIVQKKLVCRLRLQTQVICNHPSQVEIRATHKAHK